MELVPKPEGFEFREARADKSGQSRDWKPVDAMYEAYQRVSKEDVTQLVCYWWEKDKEGNEILNFSQSTESLAEHSLLLQKALHHLLNRSSK